jgi:hypothetical protein
MSRSARVAIAALALLCGAPTAARAQGAASGGTAAVAAPTSDAGALLARHAAAVGSPDAIRETRALRLVGRVRAFGMSGTIETIIAGPANLVQSIDLGAIRQTMGLARGSDAWAIDPNGTLRPLEGEERIGLVTDAWFASLAYVGAAGHAEPLAKGAAGWAADGVRQSGEIARDADAGGGEAACAARLAITPPGGRARTLCIDAATSRVVSAMEVHDTDTVRVEYADFREIDGLVLPFHARQSTGDPTHDVVIDLDRIERNPAIDTARFERPAAGAQDVRFASGTRAEGIRLTEIGSHIFASVRVNGRGPYSFFIDTGAGASCLDETVARELGLPRVGAVEARGVGGSETVAFVQADSLEIGPVKLRAQNLVALPLASVAGARDIGFDGILGYGFFSRFVVRIDYEKETFSLYEPGSFTPPPGATELPISLEGNVPSVAGVLNGTLRGTFRIDTGSNAMLDLHGPFVAENRMIESARRIAHRPMAGIGGMHVGVVARLESFALGPFVVRDPIVGLSEASEGAFATRMSAGNIGGGILRRFTATFDYAGGRMFLEPNARLGEREPHDGSGLACWTEGGVRRAIHVEERSPAWRAGVRSGDRVLAVNGRASGDLTDGELARALRGKPGTPVSVRFERGGVTRTVRFRLEEIL